MIEFNLRKKREYDHTTAVKGRLTKIYVYPEKDVKEFIKKLQEFLNECFRCPDRCKGCLDDILNEIDRRAGAVLVK